MAVFKSVEGNFADFKRAIPLTGATASNPGAVAAWIDMSAAHCGLPCSERPTADLERLARLVCRALQAVVVRQETLQQALVLAFYPFEAAKGVVWAIWTFNFASGIAPRDYEHDQARGISKGDAQDLLRNTQRVLAWRAEIALRHGGDYKLALERMLEPLSGFGELAEHRQQRIQANQQIGFLTQMRNRSGFRRP